MFDLLKKNDLSTAQSLELVRIHLRNARECKDTAIRLALCNCADTLLASTRKVSKKTVHNNSNLKKNGDEDNEQTLREGIAAAYLDHADLVAHLGYDSLAVASRKRAEKWAYVLSFSTHRKGW